MTWLKEQWNDIKGNAKWCFLLTTLGAAGGVRAFLWFWFISLPFAVEILSVIVFALI